jgi:hypothetical protein
MPILHAERGGSHGPVTPSRVRNQDRELVICALYSGGETLEEIGARFGICRERVRQICKRNGLSRPGSRSADPLKVLALLQRCNSAVEISNHLACPIRAVCNVLNALAPGALEEMAAYRQEATRQRVLERMRVLAARLGHPPSKLEFDRFGPATGNIQYHFGSLSHGKALAGIPATNRSHPHTTPAQRAEIALRYEPATNGRFGGNVRVLAAEYGVTVGRVLQIAKSFRAKKVPCAA